MRKVPCSKCGGIGKVEIEDEKFMYYFIGEQVRSRREKLGLRQEDIATAIGLTRTSVTNIEKGRQWCGLVILGKIAKVLECKIEEMLPSETEGQ